MVNSEREQFEVPSGEILKQVWYEQVGVYIARDFHGALRMTRQEFRTRMPRFLPQPADDDQYFTIPLLVIPLPFRQLLELADIEVVKQGNLPSPRLFSWGHADITEVGIDFTQVPAIPYTIWARNPRRYRGFSSDQAKRLFRNDEVASPLIETIGFALQYPDLFDKTMIAAGTGYGTDLAAAVNKKGDDDRSWSSALSSIGRFWICSLSSTVIYSGAAVLSRRSIVNLATQQS